MKDNKTNPIDAPRDSISTKVSVKLNQSKKAIADLLNSKFNSLPPIHKRITLMMFGLMMAVVCISLIVRSMNDAQDSLSITIDQITKPRDVYQNPTHVNGLKRILRVKAILDSLRKYPKGITVYDSLINARPGLMDSINSIIQKYQSNYSH